MEAARVSKGAAMRARGRRLFSILASVVAWAIVPLYAAGIIVTTFFECLLGVQGENPTEGAIIFAGFGAFAIVGALLVAKRPSNTVGWILVIVALMVALFPAGDMYAAYVMTTRGQPDALAILGAWVQSWYWLLLFALAFVYLPLLFPDGRLPSRRWLPVALLAGAGVLGVVVLGALTETLSGQEIDYRIANPIGIESLAHVEELSISGVIFGLLGLAFLGAFASVVVRFRRARGVERQQMKWFVYAASPLAIFPVQDYLPEAIGSVAFGWLLIGMPTAIGIAVLRYRLYDIDLVINRTIVYALLSASLILVYLVGVTVAQAALRVLTGQQEQPQLAVVATTLVIAVLFNPLRKRIQSFIDRRFYRRKYDAVRTMNRFSTKLRDETDLGALSGEVVAVVRETMQPEHVSLWLRPDTTPPTPVEPGLSRNPQPAAPSAHRFPPGASSPPHSRDRSIGRNGSDLGGA